MSYRNPYRRNKAPGQSGPLALPPLRWLVTVMVLPALGLVSVIVAPGAQAGPPPPPPAKLVITSVPFSAPASTSPTKPFTITLETAAGAATTNPTDLKIFLAGTSTGRRFATTSGGTLVSQVTLPANTKSVKMYYGDTNAGSPTITVSLTSPPSNAGLTEGVQTETITVAATTTKLSASPSPGSFGTSETLTATVASSDGPPVGSVTFLNGTTALCTAVPVTAGSAACNAPTLTPATYELSAGYTSSSPNYSNSTSVNVSLKVTAAPTSLALSSSSNPSTPGSAVTVTATVTSSAGAPPGVVTFSLGSLVLCRKVAVTAGSATCTTSALPLGPDSLTATFASSSVDYAGSTSAALIQTVAPSNTATTLSSDDNGVSTWPSSPVETATVSAIWGPQPSGKVAFFANGTPVASCAAVAFTPSAPALCTLAGLDAGTYDVTATATPTTSADNGSSSSTLVELVQPASTSTTLATTSSTVTYGSPVTLTAGESPAPGTVTFLDGSTVLCAAVPVTAGNAACITAALPVGTDPVTAVFISTSVDYAGSISAALIEAVSPSNTSTSLSSGDNGLSTWPSSPVETATVSANSGPQPSGTVAFFTDGTPVASCSAVAFTPDVPAQCTLAGLDAGTYDVTAIATPSTAVDNPSTSGPVAEVIQPASTSTTLATTSSTVASGTSVTLTADESPAPGTVTFLDGSTVLCAGVAVSAGSASCTTSALPLGTDGLTVVFISTSVDYTGSTGTVNVTVTPGPAVALVITSAAFSVPASTSPTAPFTITLEDAYGNPTTSASSYRVFLSGSSAGRRLSATPGGPLTTNVTIPAGTQSVTAYYGDSNVGTPKIIVSLTTPPTNAGLLQGSQVETITAL